MTISAYGPGQQFQHYLPQLLLDGWSKSDGKVVRYWEPRPGKIVPSSTSKRSTGGETNLYTLNTLLRGPADISDIDDNGIERARQTQLIENILARDVDTSDVKESFNKLMSRIDVTEEERRGMARFIWSLIHRNPIALSASFEKHRSEVERFCAEIKELNAGLDPTNPDDWPELAKRFLWLHSTYNVHVILNPHLFEMIREINGNEQFLSVLAACRWVVYEKSDKEPSILISDMPIVFGQEGTKTYDFVWSIPLSPVHLLFIVVPDKLDPFLGWLSEGSRVEAMNRHQMEQRWKSIYSVDKSLDRFIRKHWDTPADN